MHLIRQLLSGKLVTILLTKNHTGLKSEYIVHFLILFFTKWLSLFFINNPLL